MLVRPWREFHSLRQVRPPYVLEYQGCGKLLLYVGAVHGSDPHSRTFQVVRAVFAKHPIDFVIVEGFPEAFGISPARMIGYSQRVLPGRPLRGRERSTALR